MFLRLAHISKSFGQEQVLDQVQLELEQGQILAILGKSGSGKTTLLKIIAGLLAADNGQIWLEGRAIEHLAPQERAVVYMYQESLLFPHLNVFENIAFGLKLKSYDKAELQQKCDEMLAQLDLSAHRDKMPHQLSGGQKQRVAFGRAIIVQPKLLLLDEPFSNLDVDTRQQMQALFKTIALQYHISAVFVTHDLKEALQLGQQFGFMQQGKLETYANRQSFMDDEKTGVQKERSFWTS